MVMKETVKRIHLSRDGVSPSQASDMVHALIRETINANKLDRLRITTGNAYADTTALDRHINQLYAEKEQLSGIINDAREQGCRLSIKMNIEIAFTR